MQAARILVDGQSDLVLDYGIPPEAGDVRPGCRVQVPLRNRTATGTVLTLSEPDPAWKDRLKPILKLIDPEPLISPVMMNLASWAADYYSVALDQMICCLLPETVRQENTAEKMRKMVHLEKRPSREELDALYRKAPRQAQMLDYFSSAEQMEAPLAAFGTGALNIARSLAAKGFISLKEESVHRDPSTGEQFVPSKPMKLNDQQQKALEEITAMCTAEHKKPVLLQGVTGSGKTEVYLQAVSQMVKSGKSALIMVPEISLTPQTVQRFKSRFAELPSSVAVLHSLLSDGERFDEWHAIRSGKARIVIGPRSAVFAPLQNLGLVIVDEEHDASYKQESSPRYHGRDLAVLRAHLEDCAVVLGSATPSLESIHNALTGKYSLVKLTERADGQQLPLIRILDMKTEGRNKSGPNVISERLRMSIDRRLDKGEQVILLLNRRGFARSIQCPDCGHVVTCLHCSLPLTYHRTEDRLMCHLCGFKALPPRACPECRSANILLQGYGTQKVEEILRRTFPAARITRVDADVARRKNAVRTILNQFRTHKIDILLGTQMIAKGLDFPNVTLVGVLNADLGLHIPDPRAGERTFQLLTQVAGRAGRGDLSGEVIIQTFTPQSPSLQYARHHDTDGFAAQELEMRRSFDLPPFTHIAVLTIRSQHENMAEFATRTLAARLRGMLPPPATMTDPMPAPIPRAHGQFRFQITVKGPSARILSRTLRKLVQEAGLGDDLTAVIDVDAMSFM